MKHIVILISGRGSNMAAIARACVRERWPARVVAVIASRPDAAGLAVAQALGLQTLVVEASAFATREAFDAALAERIDGFAPDVVALAGFMRILTDAFVLRFGGRLVNVHPSLLPAFPGLRTHARAIEAGCKLAGATVHFVTPALDAGPIVAQAAVPVRAGDSPATLAERVLAAEHVIYPQAVRWLVRDELVVEAGTVRHLGGEAQHLVVDDVDVPLRTGLPRC